MLKAGFILAIWFTGFQRQPRDPQPAAVLILDGGHVVLNLGMFRAPRRPNSSCPRQFFAVLFIALFLMLTFRQRRHLMPPVALLTGEGRDITRRCSSNNPGTASSRRIPRHERQERKEAAKRRGYLPQKCRGTSNRRKIYGGFAGRDQGRLHYLFLAVFLACPWRPWRDVFRLFSVVNIPPAVHVRDLCVTCPSAGRCGHARVLALTVVERWRSGRTRRSCHVHPLGG